MATLNAESMFHFQYHKTSSEINEAAKKKIVFLTNKIEERQKRISALRTEHGIDDGALIQLLTAARRERNAQHYTYSSNSVVGNSREKEEKTIGAGAVGNLLTETDLIETEKASIKRLNLITRNVRPVKMYSANGTEYWDDSFELNTDELEFLGF